MARIIDLIEELNKLPPEMECGEILIYEIGDNEFIVNISEPTQGARRRYYTVDEYLEKIDEDNKSP